MGHAVACQAAMAHPLPSAYNAGYPPQSCLPFHQPVIYPMYTPQLGGHISPAYPHPGYSEAACAPQQYFLQPTATDYPPGYQNVYQPPPSYPAQPYPPQPYPPHAYLPQSYPP